MIVDLFAGPRGWSVGLRLLGLEDVGIEIEPNACATARAASFETVQADVSELDPADYLPAEGLIASPPCPAFSAAGKGEGREHLPALIAAVHRRDWTARPSPDPEVWLSLEVGRWWEALRPSWIALEQVPAVLPIWHAFEHVLRDDGYETWSGVLNAADYGVPQIRRRAILLASNERSVGPPPPTHAEEPGHALFDQLEPWVTMAAALGWQLGSRVGFPRLDDLGTSPDGYRERDWRDVAEPAQAVTEKARSWVLNPGLTDSQPNRRLYDLEEPAPTVAFGHDAAGRRWILAPGTNTERSSGVEPYERELDRPSGELTQQSRSWRVEQRRGGDRIHEGWDPEESPSATVTSRADRWQTKRGEWEHERPATTLAGDPRVFAPGSHIAHDGRNLEHAVGRSAEAIRITIADALVLQSFPPGYPVQGTKTRQFEQIGNAIPPLLAAHVLAAVTGRTVKRSARP